MSFTLIVLSLKREVLAAPEAADDIQRLVEHLRALLAVQLLADVHVAAVLDGTEADR